MKHTFRLMFSGTCIQTGARVSGWFVTGFHGGFVQWGFRPMGVLSGVLSDGGIVGGVFVGGFFVCTPQKVRYVSCNSALHALT